MNKNIVSISIIGSGFMGSQLSLYFASLGKDITVIETSLDNIKRSKELHINILNSRIKSEEISVTNKKNILNKIKYLSNIENIPKGIDLVIEAAPEDLKLKREIFSKLDKLCMPHTILSTNSSSIPVSKLEDFTNRQDKVINTHFYPPVWDKLVVELMKGKKTSTITTEKIISLAEESKLTPLLVNKESTGFIFNRIWRAIKKEALEIVDQDIATFEDIDRAWMILLKYPIGPFGIMDMVGLDVVRDIEMVYYNKSKDKKDLPPKVLLDKIEKGCLGKKTGDGFYSYPNPAFSNPEWLLNPLKKKEY